MLTKENGFALPVQWKFPEANKYTFTFIALFIALFLIYSNSFYGDWHFDDFFNIVQNPNIQIKSFSMDSVKHCIYALTPDKPSRPLSYFSFGLNYYFGGTDVFGYHIVNFIIHYLAAVFLFLFINNTLKLPLIKDKYENIAYPTALLATFIWALHPIHVTSITYIVQRMASMAGMFYIMSMYFYLKARTTEKTSSSIAFFIGCALAGLAAVLSKENAAMLPVCLLLYDLIVIKGINKETIIKYLKISLLPLLTILIIGFIYVDFSKVFGEYNIRDFTMMQRVLTEPRVFLFYLSLLFYPIHSRMTLLYDIDVSCTLLQPWTTTPAILLIIGIIVFACYIAKKRPLLSFCIIFYFLNHLIEGSVFNLELIYEHRNYLPAMLLFIPFAQLLIYVIDYFSYKKNVQIVVASVIVIILLGLGDITFQRNTVVSSEFLLWLDNIEKYPFASRAYTNLGNFYMERRQKEKGLYNYEKALSLNNFANTYVYALQEQNLGSFYLSEGKNDLALLYYQRARKTLFLDATNTFNTAKVYILKSEYSTAHRLIEPLVKKNPNDSKLNEIFCLILLKENKYADAENYAKTFLWNNLSSTFPLLILAETARKKENYPTALIYWTLYRQSFPLDPVANLALIELYDNLKDFNKLDEELAKLFSLKRTLSLTAYLQEYSRIKNRLVYIPDVEKIRKIVQARNILSK
jgi:protein O-mannosyl-transferase